MSASADVLTSASRPSSTATYFTTWSSSTIANRLARTERPKPVSPVRPMSSIRPPVVSESMSTLLALHPQHASTDSAHPWLTNRSFVVITAT